MTLCKIDVSSWYNMINLMFEGQGTLVILSSISVNLFNISSILSSVAVDVVGVVRSLLCSLLLRNLICSSFLFVFFPTRGGISNGCIGGNSSTENGFRAKGVTISSKVTYVYIRSFSLFISMFSSYKFLRKLLLAFILARINHVCY